MLVAIREMAVDDAVEVTGLVTQLGYRRTAEEVRAWIEAIDGEKQAAFVGVFEGRVVGWVEVSVVQHLQSARYGLIGGLVVKEGMRGMGVGRLLCQRAEEWSWARGVGTVRVTSRSTRLDAHRFYLRDGYRMEKTSLVFEKARPD